MCDQCNDIGSRRTPPNSEEKAEYEKMFRMHVRAARRYGEKLGHPSSYDDPWVALELTLHKLQTEAAELQRLLNKTFS